MNPMSELSYQAIRTANQAREADELRTDTRKKNLLILVLNYMHEEGYVDSAQSLARETNIDLSKYEVCDNIDLETILMEYESYYYVKFSKYPKITKKLGPQSAGDRRGGSHKVATRTNSKNSASTTPSLPRIPQNGRASPPPPVSGGRPKSGVQPGGRQARATQSSTRRPNGLPEKNEKMLCRVVVSDNEIKSYRDMMKVSQMIQQLICSQFCHV